MQKLAELEATAPKVTKKKMLNEDSTTPPINVSNKPASLKDMFEALSENIAPGQKPIPVLDPQNKQAGMGFVTSDNPSIQNILKNLDPKEVQIVQAPGQQPVGQQQQQRTGQSAQPAQAGATGQSMQAGQQAMQEEQLDELSPDLLNRAGAEARKRQQAAKGPQSLGTEFEGGIELSYEVDGQPTHVVTPAEAAEHIEKGILTPDTMLTVFLSNGRKVRTSASKVPALKGMLKPQTPGSKFFGMKADKFDKAAKAATSRDQAKAYGDSQTAGMSPAQKRQFDAMSKSGAFAESKQLKEKFASQQQAKLMYAAADDKDVSKKTGVSQKVAKEFVKKSHGQKVSKLPKKVKEGDIAPTNSIDTRGAGLGAGRSQTTLEGKKPDFLDLDKDGNKKEPMKKAAADKKKKKVDESMNHRISAARLEGKSHGLRGHAHSGKRYEDLEEMKAYHEGYKEGLDECYGQGVYETAPATPPATVGGMANQEMEEGKLKDLGMAAALGATALAGGTMAKGAYDYHQKEIPGLGMSQGDFDRSIGHDPAAGRPSYFGRDTNEAEMDEGNAFTAALAKTPKGGKFTVGGKTYTDRTSHDAKIDEYAFEAWDRELNNLLNEGTEVNEGLSVSISKGQQNSPDSVTITAQDQEAEHLLAFVKNAGLGLFGDDNADTHSSAMSIQPAHGAPDEVGAGGVDVEVVDGNDGIMGLMQKLSGIQAAGADDYEDEEGDEEQLHGNHEEAGKKDCGCDGDCECSDYDKPSNEGMCNECGGMMEAGHSCGSKEMVDEVESEDQMEFEVAEDNAPDSGAAETTADENAEAEEDKALALKSVNESFADILARLEKLAEGSGDEPKHPKHHEKDEKDYDDAEEEEEVTESKDEDENPEEDGPDHGKAWSDTSDELKEEEALTEWANNAGKKGTDASFEADIDFMTKIIAGGLNKPKSTGQTTVPVIAGQENRMHDHQGTVSDSIDDWTKLAGIK